MRKLKKYKIPTRIIIDYDTSVEMIQYMGDVNFVNLLNKVFVITTDEDSYYYIKEVKRNIEDTKRKNRSKKQ